MSFKHADEIIEAARAAFEKAAAKVERKEGYFSTVEWIEIIGKPDKTMRDTLSRLVARGKMDVQTERINGRTTKVYKVIE